MPHGDVGLGGNVNATLQAMQATAKEEQQELRAEQNLLN